MKPEEFIKQLEEKLQAVNFAPEYINQGIVQTVGDGIIRATGLSKVGFGEEVILEQGSRGLVLGIDEDITSIVLITQSTKITEGMTVKSTGKVLSINVSSDLIGRVIDPLGNPLDGKDLKIKEGELFRLETIAPGVVEREPVDTPLKTGIKGVDAMTPIGRGQRELIIGDRGTGKTAIAIDAILNQKKKDLNLPQVICIYCAIGQKRGNIARIVAKLQDEGAMDYTIVVAASASDSPTLQFIAPLASAAIGEYFMSKGKDVLVVYDDLTKHAWAYRQLSLLLRRPAGREAYPGDIFYLHSKLLERAAKLSKKYGGGSLTALPIIETQEGDVSAYIPTNVISITDGQINLETDLFNAGVRPAINIGLSVSRVGGAAQTKAMKQVAGPLRLELAQFRELQAFAQFGSDLDQETLKRIERGKRVLEVLKQPQYQPENEASQVVTIYSATTGLLDEVAIDKIRNFEKGIMEYIKLKNKKMLEKLAVGDKMDEKTIEELKKVISEFKKTLA